MINKFQGKYFFLSNFYPVEIEYQGITYPTSEHYYVAMKVTNQQLIDGKYFTPADFREMIGTIGCSRGETGMVKRLGQKLKIRKDWDTYKLVAMNWVIREKFKNETLKELLLATGDEEIIEGNVWHDSFWGVCECDKCPKGKNNLGKIHMEVRNELRGIKRTGLEEILK